MLSTFVKFSLLILKECMEIILENLYMDIES